MSGPRDTTNGGSAPAAPVADATHTSVAAAEPDFDTQFNDMFRHDPFEGNDGGHAPVEPTEPTQPSAPLAQAPATPPAPAPTIPDPNAATLPNSPPPTDALIPAIAALTNATQALQDRQPPASGEPAPDPALNYNFPFPAPLVAALSHEDVNVRMEATSRVLGALGREVHTRMRNEMANYARTQIPQMIQSMLRAHTFRETIRQDFFGKYPMFNNSALAPMVQQVTSEVLTEASSKTGNMTWNDKLRDAIAEKIFTAIPGLRPAAQPPAVPVAQPPRQFTNGARPPAAAGVTPMQQDIHDTLFG